MKVILVLVVVAVASASGQGLPPGFNLTQFLNMEGINPSSVITTNCLPNGSPCAGSSTPCCLSPVFVCQPSNMSSTNTCSVIPLHRPHIPIIRAIMNSFGVTTPNPVY